jgi:hypothetical protein
MRSLCLCALALAAACSTTPAIDIKATPTSLPGDGQTPATVQATVTQGGSPAANATVHFTATSGQFQQAAQGTPLLLDATTDQNGIATATLIPSHVGWGTITFTASVSLDGQQPSQSTTINLVPSGGPASSIAFSCSQQNIGAFVSGHDTIHVLCSATAKSSNGTPIPNASIQTMAEAGSIDWQVDTDSGQQELVYTVAPDAQPPVDVAPFDGSGNPRDVCTPAQCDPTRVYDATACPGEPCWTDNKGIMHNPRDGVVTLIAAVPGGPDFDTLGEPYIDTNDNGRYDPGEPYIDYNGNKKYDAGSGAKVDSRLIWTAYRVIWSGSADLSKGHGSSIGIGGSGSLRTFQLYVHDSNFNALAADADPGNDVVSIDGSCTAGQLTLPSSRALPQQGSDGYPGVLFNSAGAIAAPGNPATYLGSTDAVQFSFSYTPPESGTDSCTINAVLNRTYDPGAPGFAAGDGSTISTEALSTTYTP